jgi:glycosyltransferase involved in cell wall biosynthesis
MRFNLLGNFDAYTGYGRHSVHLARALTHLGVSVRPMPYGTWEMPSDLQRLLGIGYDVLTIALIAAQDFPSLPGRMWGYSMWETTVPPEEQVKNINQTCTRFIVPASWLIEVYQEAGVTRPMHVLPEGVDPAEFPLIERPLEDRPYTFLCLGDRSGRKGDDQVWSAFFKAFPDTDDVRLVIKCTSNNHQGLNMTNSDPRLSLWREDVSSMLDVYAHADCFVFPSTGEGWGLPAREAASTGLPVLATNWSGLTEGGIENYAIPIDYTLVDAPGLLGQWAHAKEDDLVYWMRWCFENRELAQNKGRNASNWLHANQTWKQSAEALVELVEGKHAAIRRTTA